MPTHNLHNHSHHCIYPKLTNSEKAEGEISNLGGSEPITLAHLAEELIWLTGRGSLAYVPFPRERQLIDIGNCYSSYQKFETALGWRPRTSLREGLTRTVKYFQENPEHYSEINADSFSRSLAPV